MHELCPPKHAWWTCTSRMQLHSVCAKMHVQCIWMQPSCHYNFRFLLLSTYIFARFVYRSTNFTLLSSFVFLLFLHTFLQVPYIDQRTLAYEAIAFIYCFLHTFLQVLYIEQPTLVYEITIRSASVRSFSLLSRYRAANYTRCNPHTLLATKSQHLYVFATVWKIQMY